jgi:hypothetical protein
MSGYFPAQAKVTPSYSEPRLVLTWAQPTGAFELLPGGKPKTTLGEGDKYVYLHALDIRTDVQGAQAAFNQLPSATFAATLYSTPTYLLRTRAIYDHHDTAAAASWNVSLPKAQELGGRQGIFQAMRTGLLYGFNPTNGEGMLNAANATQVSLPPDSYGNDSVSTYDNGEMAMFILGQVVQIKKNMFQSGKSIANKVVMVCPQRVGLQWELADIVQVVQYQRPGAGTATTGEVVKKVLEESGNTFEIYFDDTLIGKGAGGTDAVILTIPEIEKPKGPGINTNDFGELQPSNEDVNVMYMDMAAPRKISTPIPDGGVTDVYELRTTSGWNIRAEGLFVLNFPY